MMSQVLEFLTFVGSYGHGVFSPVILEPERAPSLRVWLSRNADLVRSFPAPHRTPKLHVLTQTGLTRLGVKGSPTGSLMASVLWDYVLMNAYLWESRTAVSYEYRPHLQLNVKGETVGLVSSQWGVRREALSCSRILMLPRQKKALLKELESGSLPYDLNTAEMGLVIAKSYTPKALRGVRR